MCVYVFVCVSETNFLWPNSLLILWFTTERSEWVICQEETRFREEELTLIQLEIESFGGFHHLFGDKGHRLNILSRTVIVK